MMEMSGMTKTGDRVEKVASDSWNAISNSSIQKNCHTHNFLICMSLRQSHLSPTSPSSPDLLSLSEPRVRASSA